MNNLPTCVRLAEYHTVHGLAWLWQYPSEKVDDLSGSLAVLLPPSGGGSELLGSQGRISKPLVEPKVPLQAPREGDKLVGLCLAGTVISLGANMGQELVAVPALCITHCSEEQALCQVHFSLFCHPSMSQPSRTHLVHCGRDRDSRKTAQIYLKAFKA